MFDDELEPRTKKPALKKLDPMSVEELEAYIAAMTAEIERANAEIARKKAYLNAASSFFKT